MNYPIIAIVGAGAVGTTTAFALMLERIPASLILVDVDEKRCRGEILDLSDADAFTHSPNISQGTLSDLNQADIIIIAAGARQKKGQTKPELIDENRKVIEAIFSKSKLKKEALVILVTNPVDALTRCTQEITGLPHNQVFGSGTILDTQRLRGYLSDALSIGEAAIHAYVLGEHGDTQFAAWSTASIGGVPLVSFPGVTQKLLDDIEEKTRNHVYEIISCKGATYFGVAACVATIVHTILSDRKWVMPISCYQDDYQVCLSMPAVVGRSGVEKILRPSFNQQEKQKLEKTLAALQKIQRC